MTECVRYGAPPTKLQCSCGVDLSTLSEYHKRLTESKHKRQASAGIKYERSMHFCNCLHYNVYIVMVTALSHQFDSYKLLWRCKSGLKGWKIPSCAKLPYLGFVWPKGKTTNLSGFASGNLVTVAPCPLQSSDGSDYNTTHQIWRTQRWHLLSC